jgi:very-short-patch-repair endonuclease
MVRKHNTKPGDKFEFWKVLNKTIDVYSADILVPLQGQKIIIEYNGGRHFAYGCEHLIRSKDFKKDKIFQELGYRVLRIKSRKNKTPSLDLLNKFLKSVSLFLDLDKT